jgi:hypothetical protein
LFIDNLTFVSNFVADLLTYVFYHNFVCCKILMGKEPIPMNLAWTNLNTLRLCLTQSVFHWNGKIAFLGADTGISSYSFSSYLTLYSVCLSRLLLQSFMCCSTLV